MRKAGKRMALLGLGLAVLLGAPAAIWYSLTLQPRFYRDRVELPPAQRQAEAKKATATALQLRNDICNEEHWKAVFTEQEVNAWLAEDLVTQFADQLPPQVHEPRVAFELDRATIGFKFDQGPISSVISVVVRARVPEENVLALTLEKIQAGIVPIASEQIIDQLTNHARSRGLDVRWEREGDLPVALIRWKTDPGRNDVVLEHVQVLDGQIRLSGRSDRAKGSIATPALPSGKVLYSTFARRRTHRSRGVSIFPFRRNSASPTS